MFVENPKQEVYDAIVKERVLVLVSMDVDALCACKILKWLFKCDNVLYTIVPVRGTEDVAAAFHAHSEQMKYVFMINCGGNFNILEVLEPEDNVTFFVADSHRPLDLDNIYNQDQVKILMKDGEELEVPEFDDIYAQSEDESEESGEDDEHSQPSKRRKTNEDEDSPHLKRQSRRKWEQKRQKLLHEYYGYAYHGSSAALIMYELAWKLSKDGNELLWWSAVGLTDQYINERINSETYVMDAESLHEHVLRHNRSSDDTDLSINCLKIAYDKELRLALYRHWALIDSICCSHYTACRFRAWTMKGRNKLHEFLAVMGVPLDQSKQKHSNMDVEIRNDLKDWVEVSALKFGLDEITYGSFNVQYGFRNKLCASDVVYAVNAILESPPREGSTPSDNFLDALDALSRNNTEKLQHGLELAKTQLIAVANQVRSLIDQVMCAGPFLYAHLREGTPDLNMFNKPVVLAALARFALSAYVGMASSKKRAATLPFVLSALLDPEKGTCLIVGVPPMADETRKNFLGRAFELAAEKTKARTRHDHFEPSVIEMKTEDRGKFIDALSVLLEISVDKTGRK